MANPKELFLKLVQIDSESGHEGEILEFIKNWLTAHKLTYMQDKQGNIWAKNSGTGQPLVLCAHLDTVKPGQKIKPIVNNGLIKSSGQTILGADNKVAVAAIFAAVEAEQARDNPRAFELLLTVKEEVGDNFLTLPVMWVKDKTVLLFDTGTPLGGVVLRSPYIVNFEIILKGKAAHASTPSLGQNVLLELPDLLKHFAPGFHDNQETTLNIGEVQIGTGINTVPGIGVIKGEIRSYSQTKFQYWQQKLTGLVSNITWSGYCPGYGHNPKLPIFDKIAQIYQKHSLEPKMLRFSGVSDANLLNSMGALAINMADGVNFPHTVNEQISVADLIKLTEIVKDSIIGL